MSNPSNQNPQDSESKQQASFPPDAMQGTEDTQSEFSVDEVRAERREEASKIDEQAEGASIGEEKSSVDTQSEFSVNERLQKQ